MRITFLMPGWPWIPSGGFRVVYEYASRLAERGHAVTVVHPFRLLHPAAGSRKLRPRVREFLLAAKARLQKPVPSWQSIHPEVNMVYVPDSAHWRLPDGDVLFATGWQTVASVLQCSPAQGEKLYLLQGYETWMGEKQAVDETWRAIPNRIVVGRWLLDIADSLGCSGTAYIPNGLDQRRYSLQRSISDRSKQIALQYSTIPVKGTRDGIEALEIVKQSHPDLKAVCFGVDRRQQWLPGWIKYQHNPSQSFIVEQIYNASAIYISPSWSEGCGMPLAEAAACGCALVATDIGGHREHIIHEQTGLLSEPRNPVAMAANICLLLENSQLRTNMALAAMDVAKTKDWDVSTTRLEEFIVSALKHEHPVEPVVVC